jgi:tRNA (guanine10-N2)-dimethyltransferase
VDELKTFYAVLSGDYEGLAVEELKSILDVESRGYNIDQVFEGVVLFKALIEDPEVIVSRAGYIREVGELITIGSEDLELWWVREIARTIGGGSVRVEASRYKGYGSFSEPELVRMLTSLGVRCRLDGSTVLRVITTEGVTIAGVRLATREPGSFASRMPRKRPVFKPGTLPPKLSRLFVNLSRLRKGDVFLDPFCGVGGFALEACLLGASKVICGDIDREAVVGALENLKHYTCHATLAIQSNSTKTPLASETVDAIATDPPYGRSTTTKGASYEELTLSFLEEARRVLKRGHYLVYAGPYEKKPWILARRTGLEVLGRYHMFVHGSLVREIVIART